ncbi:diguanylate cyclase [Microbacterium caowuchunii]|uniref:Diguanylate cyclase n=1 Tax=Microbacterium caowuchunii TaxID=2614638 RepID=A0A5N0TMY1_9MICO|nr:diguanylate cyclase [Microbacterium caowuchunii]KAA9135831.1 diguanylate cyclase [Microbacterium caowuchunii]
MDLDLRTASLMTALVANVAGAVFIIDTLLRREDGPSRYWSVSFLSGMATTVAYTMWATDVGGAFSIALANALFVNTTGFLWLGSRVFNQRPVGLATGAVVLTDLVVAGAVLVEGPDGGDWAGWLAMGISLVVLAVLAAVETVRRPMGRMTTSWLLAGVFAVQAVFYLARVIAFLLFGPGSDTFHTYFGSGTANIVTVVLVIVGVVVISMLRASRTDLRRYTWMSHVGVTTDGIMLSSTFASALQDVIERASWREELVAVISVRVEDIARIRSAFGADMSGDVTHAWRQGVRRFAPSTGLVGEDGDHGLLVVARAATAAEARRQAGVIYRGLFESFGEVTSAVIPAIGVGVALTETVGYDLDALLRGARGASRRAIASVEASVLFGGADDVLPDLR